MGAFYSPWFMLWILINFMDYTLGRNHISTLTVGNGGERGNWGPEEFCPVNSFADGFWLKVSIFTNQNSLAIFRFIFKVAIGS